MSLRLRSLIALGFLVGFYLLGAIVVLGLLAVPWAQIEYEHGPDPIGILCAIAALWVAWAMLPRRGAKDQSDGELDPAEFPALFALVRDLATRTGQRPPEKLYLLPEVNAFTGNETKWFGLRKTPIVGIGLPLLSFLSKGELSSVIAHEFGHHRGGDTRLGPLLYHTRSAIGRALQHLSGSRFLLHLPFMGYGRLFLRITRGIGRAQELAADALAREVVGADDAAMAMEKVERLAPAWDAYWFEEYLPALQAGVAPPLFEGFIEFADREELRPKLAEHMERRRITPPSPYDTHPPLEERLRALGFAEVKPAPLRESLELLGDCERAERAALNLVLRKDAEIRKLPWSQVGQEVWLPAWREEMQEQAEAVKDWRAADLRTILEESERWYGALRRGANVLSRRAQAHWLRGFAVRWLAVSLAEKGYIMSTRPGAPILLLRDDVTVDPEQEITALRDGKITIDAWTTRCASFGLT